MQLFFQAFLLLAFIAGAINLLDIFTPESGAAKRIRLEQQIKAERFEIRDIQAKAFERMAQMQADQVRFGADGAGINEIAAMAEPLSQELDTGMIKEHKANIARWQAELATLPN